MTRRNTFVLQQVHVYDIPVTYNRRTRVTVHVVSYNSHVNSYHGHVISYQGHVTLHVRQFFCTCQLAI